MNDFFKWLLKVCLTGVFWVFFLSINVNGRPLFSHAHGIFVDNVVVDFLDAEIADLWQRFRETARITFRQITSDDQKA